MKNPRFAPRSPQSLAPSFRGAKSSHKFRAAICLRRPFQRRDLLPAPRKALRLRSGEQNLHRNSAPPSASGGFFSGAICSPLPAKPCGFVPGSKIFTEIPRRHLPPAVFSAARFAPRPPQSLAASFRGAKSSQKFCAAICLRRLFQRRDLLPAPRKALRLRSGEQNLHRDSAPPSASGGFFSGAICSPLPAKPCAIVPGSKIFTQIPRRHLPPAAFSAARFAPRPPQSLEASFRGAKSSQKFRAGACHRRLLLAPSRRQSHISPSGHANRAPQIPPGGRPCWRRPAGKAIYHCRATPTGHPKSRPAADPVGAAPPAKPYITVGPRQQGAPNSARRPTMLALSRRQSLMPPSGHANRAPQIPPAGRPCWRRPAGKAIYHRRATPTGRHKFRPAADHVGATLPARPYITVGSRQQGALNPARRPTLLAPPRRQGLISPSGHANRAPRL